MLANQGQAITGLVNHWWRGLCQTLPRLTVFVFAIYSLLHYLLSLTHAEYVTLFPYLTNLPRAHQSTAPSLNLYLLGILLPFCMMVFNNAFSIHYSYQWLAFDKAPLGRSLSVALQRSLRTAGGLILSTLLIALVPLFLLWLGLRYLPVPSSPFLNASILMLNLAYFIYISTVLAIYVPQLVLGKLNFLLALGRSFSLMSGHWWHSFGFLVSVVWLPYLVLSFVDALVISSIELGGWQFFTHALFQAVFITVAACAFVVLWHDLTCKSECIQN